MIRDPHVLLKFLYEHPEAWPVRMALVEELVRDGEIDRAQSIIRESPDGCEMPADFGMRIHTLMARGAEGLTDLPPLLGFEERPKPEGTGDKDSQPAPVPLTDSPVPPANAPVPPADAVVPPADAPVPPKSEPSTPDPPATGMIRDPHVLLSFLYRHPEAWPVRMALVEELIRDGEEGRAKAIIRESPDGCPMPPEFAIRVHTVMTRGAEGLADLPPLPGFVDRPGPEAAAGKDSPAVPPSNEASTPDLTMDEVQAIDRTSEEKDAPEEKVSGVESGPVPFASFDFEALVGEISDEGELILPQKVQGGAGALVESKPIQRKSGPKPPPPNIDQDIAAIKWENYSGKLNLAEGRIPDVMGKPSRLIDRFSAVTLAAVVHLIVAVLISLVVITTPRPNPPVIVMTIPDVNDGEDLIVHRMTKPSEIEPSAASTQAVNVLTSIEMSNFALPEVEDTTMLDVTALIDGAAELGAGMSLSLNTRKQSDVNFFGISSGGKKIVFVIDATKPMLVDEKGGMFAYDKVKNEIGAMLMNLNRGTKFNIMVYSGKRVRAFREDLVPGLPSNKRLAMEWLAPLNSDYGNLDLPNDFGVPIEVSDLEGLPIQARDVAHYTKCIQKAMEWQAAAIFCISGGYERMRRSHSPEVIREMRGTGTPGSPGKPDPADKERYERDKARWDKAYAETVEWLRKENMARKEKGISPKVVLNFGQLVTEKTGVTRPRGQRRIGETSGSGPNLPPLKPIGFDDIDIHMRMLVIEHYKKQNEKVPSVHMVIFLGEDEDVRDQDKEHFHRIVKHNNGKLKMLRGLAGLEDVTGN